MYMKKQIMMTHLDWLESSELYFLTLCPKFEWLSVPDVEFLGVQFLLSKKRAKCMDYLGIPEI